MCRLCIISAEARLLHSLLGEEREKLWAEQRQFCSEEEQEEKQGEEVPGRSLHIIVVISHAVKFCLDLSFSLPCLCLFSVFILQIIVGVA